LIVAVSADKDVRGIAVALAPVARHVIATRYQQERSLPPDELAGVFRDAMKACSPTTATVEIAPDLATALARARDPETPLHRGLEPTLIHPRPEILITGSLFLVGEARVQLLEAPADPYVVTDPAPTP
jgi:folylpolyglutamate synthase/dihydropteroate synthase